MSTRAVIARATDGTWEGVYHHFDGYPQGLGKALYDLFHPLVGTEDFTRMLKVLVDEHRAGWSSIVGADWSLTPGYENSRGGFDDDRPRRPNCYCHGDRHEAPSDLLTPEDDAGTEYAYVLDPSTGTMRVLERCWEDGGHSMGIGFLKRVAPMRWKEIATVDLSLSVPKVLLYEDDDEEETE